MLYMLMLMVYALGIEPKYSASRESNPSKH
jgi:hypothetical protein